MTVLDGGRGGGGWQSVEWGMWVTTRGTICRSVHLFGVRRGEWVLSGDVGGGVRSC